MKQLDWVGNKPAVTPFKDIRSTRDAVARRKAELCLEIGKLCNTAPAKIRDGGSVNSVREWKFLREAAMKCAGSKRSSVVELEYHERQMREWSKS